MTDTAIVWLRRDLRLQANPALAHAIAHHQRVIPVYIHAPEEPGSMFTGAASNWWLHHCLLSLSQSIREMGSRLILRQGTDSLSCLQQLIADSKASAVYWNRLYEPACIARDSDIKTQLVDDGLEVRSFNSALMFEPWEMTKQDGSPYRVFTPFWKACVARGLPSPAVDDVEQMPAVSTRLGSAKLDELALLPELDWADGFADHWQPGEAGAEEALQRFIDEAMAEYADTRNLPAIRGTSALSPHLHFGEIAPWQVNNQVEAALSADTRQGAVKSAETFVRELGWREFANYLLYHFPHTVDEPMYPRFAKFRWETKTAVPLRAWQQGRTGIPIVDAGMRELWHTGWMHNRVRMIVASLLCKNLLIPWQEGAAWFEDTLVDADLASNTLGWQWTAGCGADAAPFFRIFNPATQAEKFDAGGEYIRHWVPELASLPDKYIARPWEAPASVLEESGFNPGEDYPLPLVDLKQSRERALERYKQLSSDS